MASDTPAKQAEPFTPAASCYNRRWCIEAGRCTNAAPCKVEPSDEALKDPTERLVAELLTLLGITYVHEAIDKDATRGLDFCCGDIFVEAKQFFSHRVVNQLCRADNVILFQGNASVRLFIKALRSRLAAKDEALAAAQKRIAELEDDARGMWPAADDGQSVFIDGQGIVSLDYEDARLKRAEAAEAALAECRAKVIEECAARAEDFETDMGHGPVQQAADAIRALAKEAPRHE